MDFQHILGDQDQITVMSIFKDNFVNIYKIFHELDPKEGEIFQKNNHYYHNQISGHNHNHDSCSAELMKSFFIPEENMTFFQKELYNMLKDYQFRGYVSNILEDLGLKFFNIKRNGMKDSLEWNDEAESFVLNQILNQGVNFFFVNQLRKKARKDDFIESKQPMLLATPNSWYEKYPKTKLDFMNPKTLEELFNYGFSKQDFKINIELHKILYSESIYFYHEGRFEAPSQAEAAIRNDRFLNFTFSMIEKKSTPFLHELIRSLISIPFELNLKANVIAQVSESFQLSYFKREGFHKAHFDSSFEKNKDTGRKISVFYLFAENSDASITLNLYDLNNNFIKEAKLKTCELFLLKSRVVAYEIKDFKCNCFLLRYWINGPSDELNLKI